MSQSGYKANSNYTLLIRILTETLYTSPTLKDNPCLMDMHPKELCKKLVANLEENFDKKKINLNTFSHKKKTT
jgi:tRNA(Phe) wybutosine-synthesizing methylase Tyw3